MSDNNLSLQEDEVQALTAIFGNDFVRDSSSSSTFTIEIQSGQSETFSESTTGCNGKKKTTDDKSILLELKLPKDYPLSSPPFYSISAPWMSRVRRTHLTSCLDNIYADNAGEAVLYLWIQKCREFLSEDILVEEEEAESDDNDTDLKGKKDVSSSGKNECKTDLEATSLNIFHGEPVVDRRSVFQAHACLVSSVEEVKEFVNLLKNNKKIATATHNIVAYRLSGGPHGSCVQDCDDDGETHAGGRLLHLLQILDVKDVVVVVSRWFGGIQLGPDRFKHINNVARNLLNQLSLIPSSGKDSNVKSKKETTAASKKSNKKVK